MADTSHLEKMGRELKCPICLSLLKSAVSLTCNHVFCNLCVMKSMTSASNCPVCKVPYQRREVRPAPHMDNLVSIYKSMEDASGINIFVTQNAPSTKESDGQHQVEVESNSCRPETGGTSRGKPKKQRICKGKGSKELVKTNAKNSDPHPLMKPSFPAKKRVHVPQYLPSETTPQPQKCEGGSDKHLGNVPKDSSIRLKEKPAFNEKGEPVFSPFFWLREEDDDDDVEKLSGQEMEGDHVMDTPPQNAPSFSDLKDSDDESPTKLTPTGKVPTQSKGAEVFDSEMFEWTQRACSPELYSTPVKKQVAFQNNLDGVQEGECEEASQFWTTCNGEQSVSENAKIMSNKQENRNTDTDLLSSPQAKNAKAQNGRKKSNKRVKRTIGRVKRKYVKISIGEEVPNDSNKIAEGLHQGSKCAANDIALNSGKKICKRNKQVSFNCIAVDKVTEDVPTESIGAKIQNQGNANMGTKLPVLSGNNPENNENLKLKCKGRKNIKKTTQCQRNHRNSSENQDADTTVVKMLKEIPIHQNQRNENINSQLPVLSCLKSDDGRTFDLDEKPCKIAKKVKIQVQRNCAEESRKQKRLKVSIDDNAKDGLVAESLGGSSKAAAKKIQTIKGIPENLEIRAIDNSKMTEKVLSIANDSILQKCESLPGQTRCAFCQSSLDSKASGEMLHYFNGRPVAADYNGGSNIIHAHRNCTEWAPNVYFEDQTAINLETELARSRRIKCSCCGIKGAALGCYEKSCRKSFHFPCAKLVSQCRWDTENFVMLCPLHSSSKLPREISGTRGQSRKRSIQKGISQAQHAERVVQHGASTSWLWKCPGSPNKWVICCSGLTIAEKGNVSEFARLAGVSVSKTWSSSVTHVIASTDENGACRRTLKFLMGILEGKWILKIDWIKACMKAMEPIAEEQCEISVDIHGIRDGPRLGRLRVLNKQPKLFNGFKFYFTGEFMPSYKGYLQDLVVAAGGTVLQRKPISGDTGGLLSGSSTSTTFIIYSLELPDKFDSSKKTLICNRRRNEAEALASSTGAKVAGHTWVLDTIAACKLQTL